MNINLKDLGKIIEVVLQENSANLEELFRSDEDLLKQLCSELFQKKILTKVTKEKPTFDKVRKEFINHMLFMKTVDKFREHCISFIASLQSLDGAPIRAAQVLKTEWTRTIHEKLKFDFKIEENPTAQETNCSDEEGRHRSIYSYHGQYRASDTNTTSVYQGQRVPIQHPTSSSVLWQQLQTCPYLRDKIYSDIRNNFTNVNVDKSLKTMCHEAQRNIYDGNLNQKSTDDIQAYANEPQESKETGSTAAWSVNQGSHYADSATQYPNTEQVISHNGAEKQIRNAYTDPSYRYNFPPHKSDQSISRPQEEHESPDQSVPVTISSPTNDSRNPLQATTTFASETFSKEMLVAMSNGSTIPRSPSFNKLNNIQTEIDNLKTKVEHLQVQVNTKGAEIRNNTSGKDPH